MKLDNVIFNVDDNTPVPLDIEKIIKGRALFQANSGGGKSYLLRRFLEASNGKVQQIIIDPEGEFSTLREKYDYLLVGKDNADIQIDTRHAALLAKKLMETGANAILDLYEMSPFERIRFVKVFVDALVNLPKSLWHPCFVVIDEIHTFAPESSKGRSESLESVASLASRGRKRGYALIGATQKLSKFHKDVAAELNTKFTGRCTLDIDQKRASAELGMTKNYTELRNLDHEFYVFGPGIDGIVKVKSYPVETTHEDIGSSNKIQLGNPNKIKNLMKDFTELPQEAENELRTEEDLKKKIIEQKNEIVQLKRIQPKQDPQAIENAYKSGYASAKVEIKKDIQGYVSILKVLKMGFGRVVKSENEIIGMCENSIIEIDKILQVKEGLVIPNLIKHTPSIIPERVNQQVSSDDLGRCEKAILETLAKFGKPCTKVKIGIFAGYSSKSGGFSNAVSKLKTSEFVIANNGDLEITQLGLQQVSDFDPLPSTNYDILKFWVNRTGKCPGAILSALVPVYPDSMSREDVGLQTNYSATSGGFSNGISKLKALGLIKSDNGMLCASEEMFV